MTTFYIYQSPKREKKRSAPVGAHETLRRKLLEAQGWTIVEVIDEEGSAVPVLGVIENPQEAQKLAEVNQQGEAPEAQTLEHAPDTPVARERPEPGGEIPATAEGESSEGGEPDSHPAEPGESASGEGDQAGRKKKG